MFDIIYSPEDIKRQEIIYRRLKEGNWALQWKSFLEEYGRFVSIRRLSPSTLPSMVVQFSLVPVRLNDMLDLLEGLEEQTVKTKWMTAEIDRITALIYFIVTISVFIVAIAILPGLLHKFSQVSQDIEFVRLGILAFSILALSTVAYMLILRIRRLLDKATTVFFMTEKSP